VKKTLCLLVLFISSCDYFEFKYHPWLILVESTYRDYKNPQEKTTFQGHGFLINVYGRSFVVTAAHLSQGGMSEKKSSLALKYFNSNTSQFENLKQKNRFAINRRDVEVVEIEIPPNSGLKALADWIAPQVLGPSEAKQFPLGKLLVAPYISAEILKEKSLEPKGWVALSLKALLPHTTLITEKLKSPHSSKSYDELKSIFDSTDSFLLRHRIDSSLELVKGEIFAETSIQAGMSGLPLILKTFNYDTPYATPQALVGGLITSGSRSFNNSWPTHEVNIGEAIIRLLQGEADQEKVYWYSRDGILFRKGTITKNIKLSFEEALFVEREEKGNGERADGGNGERADGGNGERADGGNGERANGGNGERFEHSNNPLDKVIRGGMGFSLSAPQEEVQLKEISIFKILAKNKKTLLTPADMSTLNWIIDELSIPFSSIEQIDLVGTQENLIMSIWENWKENFQLPKDSTHFETTLVGEQLTPFDQYQKFAPQLTLNYGKTLKITLQMGFDSIEFEMLENGSIKNVSQEFQNIVTLKSIRNQSYSIDLSDMFLNAISKIPYKKSLSKQGRIRFKVKDKDKEYLFWKNL